nr:MAG TPA: High potential iron-sulfur protein like [Caudoviricetes sp.]
MGEKCMNCKHFVKRKHGIRGALKGCCEIRI